MFWFFVYAIGFAIVTALAAGARGHNAGLWAGLGFLFGIFALIAVLVIKPGPDA